VEMPSREETEKVISVLIENEEIKSVLMKEESHLSIETVSRETREVREPLLTVPNYL
jgi:hypothetical protein